MASSPSQVGVPPLSAASVGASWSSNEQQIRLQVLASLFAPGSPNGSYIAHLKTWEDVPGAPPGSSESKKPRYILLAVTNDGRLKLHKSKRNMNSTFSIGKTWSFEEVRALEVHKPRRSAAGSNMAVPCFTITINNKSYLWETESARQQDDFLIIVVRAYRQYQNGNQPRLIGFQVGEIPGAAPAYEVPAQNGGMATPTSATNRLGASLPTPGIPRPATAQSMMSTGSSRYDAMQQQQQRSASAMQAEAPASSFAEAAAQQQGSLQAPQSTGVRMSPSSTSLDAARARNNATPTIQPPAYASSNLADQSTRPDALAGPNMRRRPSAGNLSNQGSASGRPPLPNPPAASQQPLQVPTSAAQALSPTRAGLPPSRSATPTRALSNAGEQASPRKGSTASTARAGPSTLTADPKTPKTASTIDESTAAAKAAALLGQDTDASQDDSDVVLTNVEEMLEGLEWGASAHGHSADQLEKRLMGELNALEAAGIHAIIESDDRVNDVVRYLDNALAELDKMDLMISLYKTHLNAVSDDISHIESQHQGLQLQSSNQRALLAELDRRLASS